MDRHPMQPIIIDEQGTARFKQNKIVRFLVDWARDKGMSLNELSLIPFPKEDWEHFAQLIGYSVSGYGELSYVSHKSWAEADKKVEELLKKKRRP